MHKWQCYFANMTLAEYLKARKLSQKALADKMGVSHTTVARWANGYTTPRGRAMHALTRATGGEVTAVDFFPDEPTQRAAPTRASGFAETQSPLVPEARALGLDPAAIAEAALRKAISDEKARRWAEENREAIEAYNRYFEENDTPLAQYRAF